MQTKECALCHRIGYRAFVPYGSELWRCTRDDLCARRVERRTRLGFDDWTSRRARPTQGL